MAARTQEIKLCWLFVLYVLRPSGHVAWCSPSQALQRVNWGFGSSIQTQLLQVAVEGQCSSDTCLACSTQHSMQFPSVASIRL
jgi:hypothetical protein